ncbi:alpha-ketoglutarate-dependent dioxygenase AlkB [Tamilnaduibacter salinus]|uniref:Alpha-ketoglutarate-dependent dioxygenase AlkB n=1 Tax=Tamilnaduibacter salinus TaxID=1484056 RepID=A0A2A2I6N8_9GAMM|nr:alpha-ketoglutarate-dependent dioxygenase AlkB [Tamilnaduibacter salinus]PAV26703.1 alpha-ketoglutarate-dependent dioxygenase AlkB [Tamilnaduibacter salinus]
MTAAHPIDLFPHTASLFQPFLSAAEADRLFRSLGEHLPWYQARLNLFGRWHWSPRLQCWIADEGVAYTYSGLTMAPEPWPDDLARLRDLVSEVAGVRFNSVLCNWYRNGQDSMGWHSDDEPELGEAPVVASVTFGDERPFQFRRKGERRLATSVPLGHNSLLVMPAGLQGDWQHGIPKTRKSVGPRLNLTFRRIL